VLGAMNATFIALTLKKDNPTNFDDFWPISLCNSIYNIISKIIARRIKVVLSRAILVKQFGFLKEKLLMLLGYHKNSCNLLRSRIFYQW
jgi:hypothetical protein